jgi:tRNA(Ile)-lysidine synthase
MPGADGPVGAEEARRLFAAMAGRTRLAVAVSGGRDSMALLRLLARWTGRRRDRPHLVALSVDHALRPGSAGEVAQVAAWCAAIGVEHHGLVWCGVKPATRIEERAREARYRLLTGWCRAEQVPAIALAHHREDQAETFLMRLARSSGVDGLAAMAPLAMRDGIGIWRPLLDISRARIEASLAEFGQDWIDDPANADPAFERVRMRAERAALERLGLAAPALAATAAKLRRAAAALDRIADDCFTASASVDPAGYVHLDAAALADAPDEIALRVLARAILLVGGQSRLADAALARARTAIFRASSATTLGRCRISRRGAGIEVVRESRSLPRCELAPGAALVWDRRFAVTLGRHQPAVELGALGKRGFAAARRLDPALEAVPAAAGWALPGGFRAGSLALAPELAGDPAKAALAVTFLGVEREPRHA